MTEQPIPSGVPDAKCARCGAIITLIKTGITDDSYKWLDDPNDKHSWHCGHDPAFPVRAHAPKEGDHQ